jgi:hypothetical protein
MSAFVPEHLDTGSTDNRWNRATLVTAPSDWELPGSLRYCSADVVKETPAHLLDTEAGETLCGIPDEDVNRSEVAGPASTGSNVQMCKGCASPASFIDYETEITIEPANGQYPRSLPRLRVRRDGCEKTILRITGDDHLYAPRWTPRWALKAVLEAGWRVTYQFDPEAREIDSYDDFVAAVKAQEE